MTFEQEQQLIGEIKTYIAENLPLSKMSDDDLNEKVELLVAEKIGGLYCPIDQRVSIAEQIFSSIRGFGLLDSILKDDTITEVMINGPENIFIEQNGRLFKLDKQFESQRRLEDVIQRIVGLAGREVNQANPICDTRLPDGSRVN
ncbi:MAG: Flp pilus assembly complex ATPase component TadA, partial [Oscillospiraceae bacterium]|nr:Flp pilus assembly complex ATPase component TadA [Oscillospiraceae bacterium]